MQNHAQDAKGRGRPPKQRGDKLLTREMLVHVGTEVLTEKGYSAVGVEVFFLLLFQDKGRVRRGTHRPLQALHHAKAGALPL